MTKLALSSLFNVEITFKTECLIAKPFDGLNKLDGMHLSSILIFKLHHYLWHRL